jgi:hypothetical protein
MSDTTGIVEAQYTIAPSSTSYVDLIQTPSTNGLWLTASTTFIAPLGATSVNIYHIINNAGFLNVASPSLVKIADPATFSQGMVSLMRHCLC